MKQFILSKYKKLNLADMAKSIVVSFLSSFFTAFMTGISDVLTGGHSFDWLTIAKVAAGSGIGYLIKNYYTNSDGQIARKEQK